MISIRSTLNYMKKYLVLGVAFDWGYRKGLDVFLELRSKFSPAYKIVLVGIDDNTKKTIPDDIICIPRTNNQSELAQIYTAADVFVNPTREDNFPTVNMEAIACGTPVISFNTGGSPEIIETGCGLVVENENIDDLVEKIKQIVNDSEVRTKCICTSISFDQSKRFQEYISLYK